MVYYCLVYNLYKPLYMDTDRNMFTHLQMPWNKTFRFQNRDHKHVFTIDHFLESYLLARGYQFITFPILVKYNLIIFWNTKTNFL